MWEIWANSLLPKALKSCPKCKNRQLWSHCLGHSMFLLGHNHPYVYFKWASFSFIFVFSNKHNNFTTNIGETMSIYGAGIQTH